MKLIVTAVTVYNVLTLGYCQGNLLSQAVLTRSTSTLRVFVCTCSDAASCTADTWRDRLAECRQMAENIKHETTQEITTSAEETTTSAEETTTSAQETTTSVQETTTLAQSPTTTAPCVSDCSGLSNGKYQSCVRCDGYVECSHGNIYNRPCASGTLWNDNKKNCLYPPSPTCVP